MILCKIGLVLANSIIITRKDCFKTKQSLMLLFPEMQTLADRIKSCQTPKLGDSCPTKSFITQPHSSQVRRETDLLIFSCVISRGFFAQKVLVTRPLLNKYLFFYSPSFLSVSSSCLQPPGKHRNYSSPQYQALSEIQDL